MSEGRERKQHVERRGEERGAGIKGKGMTQSAVMCPLWPSACSSKCLCVHGTHWHMENVLLMAQRVCVVFLVVTLENSFRFVIVSRKIVDDY